MRLRWEKPRKRSLEFEKVILIVAAPVIALAVIMKMGAPLNDSSLTLCTFRRLTHHPCLTCGATRSLSALIHGRLLEAFAWNPLVALIYISLALGTIYAVAVLALRLPRLRVDIQSRREAVVLTALAAMTAIANWAYVWITQGGS